MVQQQQDQPGRGGCCTYSAGFKCLNVWAITLSSIGLLFSFFSASFLVWALAIVTLVISSTITCTPLNTAKNLAIVGAVFAFITLSFQIIIASTILSQWSKYCVDNYPSYTVADCEAISSALGAISIIGCLLWLGAFICFAMLAINMYQAHGRASNSSYIPGGTARPQELEPDIEVANSIQIVEKINPDGSKTIEKTTKINPDGSKTIEKTTIDKYGFAHISATTENYDAGEADEG